MWTHVIYNLIIIYLHQSNNNPVETIQRDPLCLLCPCTAIATSGKVIIFICASAKSQTSTNRLFTFGIVGVSWFINMVTIFTLVPSDPHQTGPMTRWGLITASMMQNFMASYCFCAGIFSFFVFHTLLYIAYIRWSGLQYAFVLGLVLTSFQPMFLLMM